MNDEVQLLPQPFQQHDVAAPFVAKGERAANTQAVNRAAVPRQALNEFFTRDLTEFFVEMNQPCRVDAQRFDDAQFL